MSTASSTGPHPTVRPALAVAGRPVLGGRSVPHAMTASPSPSTAPSRYYWPAQFFGWGAFMAANVVISLFFQTMSWKTWVWLGLFTMVGIELSHRYREHIARRGWKELPFSALWWRAALAVLGLAVVHGTILMLTSLWAFGPSSIEGKDLSAQQLLGIAFANLVNLGIVYSVWSGVYFAWHGMQRQRRAEIERLRLEAAVKEAELRALKSQINPHFIFNSLNTVRALIDEEPGRAREAITRLANLLRYSLQSGQQATVPFEEELEMVNNYLALEQVRHEARLRVKMEIDPRVLDLPVPPMLLQTLAENAVKYGIAPRREGGEIRVTARLEPTALVVRMTNPGSLGQNGASTRVGLRNSSDRLRLLFGERAAVELREEAPGSVVAEVRIPRNELD
jgi:two-component sensor histidine kinase